MTKQVRKNHTPEFRREAVRLVTDEGYKIAEAARSLDINANMLGRWVREAREGSETAFPGKGNLSPEQEEIRRLREENKRLRMEKEILKNRSTGCWHPAPVGKQTPVGIDWGRTERRGRSLFGGVDPV